MDENAPAKPVDTTLTRIARRTSYVLIFLAVAVLIVLVQAKEGRINFGELNISYDVVRPIFEWWWVEIPAIVFFVTAAFYIGFIRNFAAPGKLKRCGWVVTTFFAIVMPLVLIWFGAIGLSLSGTLNELADHDTVETVLNCLLVLMVPINNIWVLHWLLKKDYSRPLLMGTINGIAMAASLLYAILFLPIIWEVIRSFISQISYVSPSSLLSMVFLLLLMMGPASATGLSIAVNVMLGKVPDAELKSRVARITGTTILASMFIMLFPGTQELVTRLTLNDAYGKPETRAEALRLLRTFHCEDEVLRKCYWSNEVRLQLLPIMLAAYGVDRVRQGYSIDSNTARKVYYRLTGVPFNEVPKPNINASLSWWGATDPDFAGTEVGGKVGGLELATSSMDCVAGDQALATRIHWNFEFKNTSERTEEARALILLPPHAVVSEMKLMIDGKWKDAVFNRRDTVRSAYQAVVHSMRDPSLVTSAGPDKVLLQCFPVPVNGSMKVELQIAAPFSIEGKTNASVRLPCLLTTNFEDKAKHAVTFRSMNLDGTEKVNERVQTTLEGKGLESYLIPVSISDNNRRKAPNLAENDGTSIVQVITQETRRKPEVLYMVIECSKSMEPFVNEISDAIAKIPDSTQVRVIYASDEVQSLSPFSGKTNKNTSDVVRQSHPKFAGGQDDLRPLAYALWMNLSNKAPSAVLWVHGPQPVVFGSDDEVLQLFRNVTNRSSVLYDLQLKPGPNKLTEVLETSPCPLTIESLRPIKASDTTSDLVSSVLGDRPPLQIHRNKAFFMQEFRPVVNQELRNDHLTAGALWAADEVREILKTGGGTSRACDVAMTHRIVTPVSGAVVLETNEQYAKHDLDADKAVSPYASEPAPQSSSMNLNFSAAAGAMGGASSENETMAKKMDLESKCSAKGKVVYAVADVKEGATFPTEALEEKELEMSKIPVDAVTSSSLVAGRMAKYSVSAGQIISVRDIAPMGLVLRSSQKPTMKIVCVNKEIDPSARIDASALEEHEVDFKNAPEGAIPFAKDAVGRVCKDGLTKGQIIRERDVISDSSNSQNRSKKAPPSVAPNGEKKDNSLMPLMLVIFTSVLTLGSAYVFWQKKTASSKKLAILLASIGGAFLLFSPVLAQIASDLSKILVK